MFLTSRLDRLDRQRLQADLLPERLRDGASRSSRSSWLNSLIYGGIATLLTFLVGFPVAYTIAFRGGRYKSFLLFLVIAPFFTSFLIRTISWKILLNDTGPSSGRSRSCTSSRPSSGCSTRRSPSSPGITYNFLPFMVLPLYVALEKIDPKLIEAAKDLYASGWGAFRRVTFPLSLPGVFAGTILTFIPALGDWVNAELLGQHPDEDDRQRHPGPVHQPG